MNHRWRPGFSRTLSLSDRLKAIQALLFLPLTLAAIEPGYEALELYSASSPSSSRDTTWKPGDGVTLEVSGLDWIGPDRIGVTVRKGDVWFLDGVLGDDPAKITYHRFASGLHEPLGLLQDGDSFLVVQRTEMTRLRDTDGDGIADEYLTAARGWDVTGAYHGYAYGPERDGQGNLWLTINLDMGDLSDNKLPWHGWALVADGKGGVLPMAAGLRSPCGLGANLEGDMFVTDQQGTWVAATPVHHLRKGVFYTNQEALPTLDFPDSPVKIQSPPPKDCSYPEAVRAMPQMAPASVWLPYNKMGRSGTDIQVIDQQGKFGPFDGQLLVGEFTNSAISRVFLEKVKGEYQGACFPFLSGFSAAVVRLAFAPDGSLFVGMTNRGWSSLGNRSYGLTRVRQKGEIPFSSREMQAKPDGFELVFTEPVDPPTAADPASYTMESYTYHYSGAYGSDEIEKKRHKIESATVSADGLSVHLKVANLRELHVHELRAEGLRSKKNVPLLFPDAYYTLNRIP